MVQGVPIHSRNPKGTWASRWLRGKESARNAGEPGSVPGSERSPGEGNGSPLQHSPMDRGAWGGYSPWGRKRGGYDLTTERASLKGVNFRIISEK